MPGLAGSLLAVALGDGGLSELTGRLAVWHQVAANPPSLDQTLRLG